jgi:tetratricopeptide (TPR) repeat protein
LTALQQATFAERADFGWICLDRLQASGRRAPLLLFADTATAAVMAGDGDAADALHARAAAALDAARATGETIDPNEAGHLIYVQARRCQQAGDLAGASARFQEAADLAREARDPISAAVARGGFADIQQIRGEFDAALRIYREEQLPVYERHGAIHERAITLGKIADILLTRAEFDEALRIRRDEQLPVYERIDDMHSCAVTKGQIARLLAACGEVDEALRIKREEELPVYERLGADKDRANAMGEIADILDVCGEFEEALRISREEQLPIYDRLGAVRERAVTMGRIADILEDCGELEEALRIRCEEQLPVYERLGDAREKSLTLYNIAIGLMRGGALQRGFIDQTCRILADAFDIAHRLQILDGIAIIGMQLGEVLVKAGQKKRGLAVLEEAATAFDKLGDTARAAQSRQLIEQIKSA